MNPEVLVRVARAIAAHLQARGVSEWDVLRGIRDADGRLAPLLDRWNVAPEQREEIACRCLGFTRRDRLPETLGRPVHPQALASLLSHHAVLLFQPEGARPVLATHEPLVAGLRDRVALLMGTVVDLIYMRRETLAQGRDELGLPSRDESDAPAGEAVRP